MKLTVYCARQDEQEALRFDASLPEQPEKRVLPCQETFYILSSAVLP